MSFPPVVSRRKFLQSVAVASGASVIPGLGRSSFAASNAAKGPAAASTSLEEFGYGDVSLDSEIHEQQLKDTHAVLMGLSDDSLLKPFRQMSGQPAPGEDLGGWYHYDPE